MTIPTRTAIIAGNWKMHYGPRQASHFVFEIVSELGQLARPYPHILCILCPPAISLAAVREVLDAQLFPRIELSAHNIYYQEKRAFTCYISPAMLNSLC